MATHRESLREQIDTLRGLPMKKKAEHIWIYYKWHLLVLAAVIVVIVSAMQVVVRNNKTLLISGMFLNNATTEEGYVYLTDDYVNYCGVENSRAEVVQGRSIDFTSEPLSQEDAGVYMILGSMIGAKSLDYIITDEATLAFLNEEHALMDLTKLLPSLEGYDTVTVGGFPAAIRIGQTRFAKDYPLYAEDGVIAFIYNSRSIENDVRFLEYLMKE